MGRAELHELSNTDLPLQSKYNIGPGKSQKKNLEIPL